MAITQEQIDALDAAIVGGEHSVTYNGRTVTYRSVSELLKARDLAVAQLARQTAIAVPGYAARSNHFQFKTHRE